ncbi:MAG: DNA mismatch repair endonuclease MutL [Chloroflexia bacterium]
MAIEILPPEVVAKIAAGEVVERPASVVKELVENAIDAGARHIRVEIRAGGRQEIRVVDDGCGIPVEDIERACRRHATSKIRSAEDLDRVRTLGFRGEALASIAAVSHLTLVSRPAGQSIGMEVRAEGDTIAPPIPRACTIGTVVLVRDLFFNTPARLKFLKTPRTEAAYIYSLVCDYAFAHPQIAFHLLSDGRTLLRTTGSGRLLDALVEVYGLETAQQMIPVESESREGVGLLRVIGYVGQPSLSRASRRAITFFVNGRRIRDTSLTYAVEEAYHTLLMAGRHPIAVIGIEIDPGQVDVNVHPTKSEVRFAEPERVFAAVQRAVRESLREHAEIPQVAYAPAPGTLPAGAPVAVPLPTVGGDLFPQEATAPAPRDEKKLPPLRVLGQLASSYILAEGPEGLYIIDQHAAHERILYEQLQEEHQRQAVRAQVLLEPVLLHVNPLEEAFLEERVDELERWGFVLEPFGDRVYRVRSVPAVLARMQLHSTLESLLEAWIEGARRGDAWEEAILITIACHSAVRAGQTLTAEEMRQLVRLLEKTRFPRTCPHGRPTMILLSQQQLSRDFRRR